MVVGSIDGFLELLTSFSKMGVQYQTCYHLAHFLARSFFDYRVKYAERVIHNRGCIIAMNHQSYLDPPLVVRRSVARQRPAMERIRLLYRLHRSGRLLAGNLHRGHDVVSPLRRPCDRPPADQELRPFGALRGFEHLVAHRLHDSSQAEVRGLRCRDPFRHLYFHHR